MVVHKIHNVQELISDHLGAGKVPLEEIMILIAITEDLHLLPSNSKLSRKAHFGAINDSQRFHYGFHSRHHVTSPYSELCGSQLASVCFLLHSF